MQNSKKKKRFSVGLLAVVGVLLVWGISMYKKGAITSYFSAPLSAENIQIEKQNYDSAEPVVLTISEQTKQNLTVEIRDPEGTVVDVKKEIADTPQGVSVTIHPSEKIKPGEYTIEVHDKKGTVLNTHFSWGVLAINVDQSSYEPGDYANISFAVLNQTGDMVCDASLLLTITHSNSGKTEQFSTESGDITTNPECKVYGLTYNPDYEMEYLVTQEGEYTLDLSATTNSGTYTISDAFLATEDASFTIRRNTATRIYPVVDYPVEITIYPNEDFSGEIREVVPSHFIISENSPNPPDLITDISDTQKELIWYEMLQKNVPHTVTYIYDAPDSSPELYEIGPLTLTAEGSTVFSEVRTWKIAVDAVAYDAQTDVTNTTSFSHTTSGSDRLLLAFVSLYATGNPDVSAITYNGVGMTKITEMSYEFNTNRFLETQVYRLVAPATGSNTLSITFAGTYIDTGVSVISYTGVDQTTPIGATGTNSGNIDPTVTFTTSNSNSLVVAGAMVRGGDSAPFTPGSGVTERWDNNSGAHTSFDIGIWGGEKAAATAGSYTVDATSSSTDFMSIIGVEVNEAASGIAISGNVYQPGTTTALSDCDGSTNNVAVRVGSSTYTTSCNASTGAWTVSGVTQPSAGDGIVAWIDGETTDGALVSRYDGTGDSTGNIFYGSTVTFTSDDSTAVSNSHADTYDNGNDADIPYTVTTSNITVNSGTALLVYTGKTYDPNGTVTTNSTGGSFTVGASSTAYLDTATSTIGTDVAVENGGTLNIDANTTISGGDITLTGTGSVSTTTGTPTTTVATGGTLGGGTGTLTFYNLSLSSTGTSVLDAALTILNDLTIGDGTNAHTLDAETNDPTVLVTGDFTVSTNGTYTASSSSNLTVQGDFTNNGTISEGTSTVILSGSAAAALDTGCSDAASCTSENLYNLTINKSTAGTNVSLSSTDLRLSNTLTITTGTLVQSTFDIRAEGGTAVSVASDGTWTNTSTGTVVLGGSVSNAGTVTLQSNGSGCGDANSITISSTSGGSQRAWSGAGTFSINDVVVSDQGGTALITAFSSENGGNNASNWTILGDCSATPQNSELLRHGEWFSGEIRQKFSY